MPSHRERVTGDLAKVSKFATGIKVPLKRHREGGPARARHHYICAPCGACKGESPREVIYRPRRPASGGLRNQEPERK